MRKTTAKVRKKYHSALDYLHFFTFQSPFFLKKSKEVRVVSKLLANFAFRNKLEKGQ
jgi:hypothetical protein